MSGMAGPRSRRHVPGALFLPDHLSFLLSPALPWALVSLLLEPGGHLLDILTDRWSPWDSISREAGMQSATGWFLGTKQGPCIIADTFNVCVSSS